MVLITLNKARITEIAAENEKVHASGKLETKRWTTKPGMRGGRVRIHRPIIGYIFVLAERAQIAPGVTAVSHCVKAIGCLLEVREDSDHVQVDSNFVPEWVVGLYTIDSAGLNILQY